MKRCAKISENSYHGLMVHPAVITHGCVKEALILGGLDGAAARELLKYKSMRRITIAGSDGRAAVSCRKNLDKSCRGVFDSPRTRLLNVDAEKFVETVEQKFDLIISDLPVTGKDGSVSGLYKIKFYKKLKNRMRKGSMFVLQAGSGSGPQVKFCRDLRRTLKGVFKYCFPYYAHSPSTGAMRAFLLCSDYKNPADMRNGKIKLKIKNTISKQFLL